MRFQLASMLFVDDKRKAKYELDKCIATRKQAGYSITWEMQNLMASLESVQPASEVEQKGFYREQEQVVEALIRNG